MKICSWRKGTGELKLKGKGWITCLNCKGSKKGRDGGATIQKGTKPWMIGNKNQSNKGVIL